MINRVTEIVAEQLTGSLQENLLTLLAFDAQNCVLVRNVVEVGLFSSDVYRDIVSRIYAFIDTYHKPPREHLPDLFEDVLHSESNKQRPLYEDLLHGAYELSQNLNSEYVLSQLEHFVRLQQLKVGVMAAGDALQAGDHERAEVELETALKRKLSLFSRGITLEEGLEKLANYEALGETVPMGITELDKRHLGPTRKELHLFIAPPKRGKSWFAAHIAKKAVGVRWRVVVITLEMSEERYAGRMLQTFFGVSKRKAEYILTQIEKDQLGRLLELHTEEKIPALAFDNEKTFDALRKKLGNMHGRKKLLMKAFPTGSLTVNGLRAYLDSLERMENFIPDLVVLDYADLMRIDAKNYRFELGTLYKDLRGLAVERNMALATSSQANRAGAGARIVTDVHAAEDWSKIATADCVLTYNQTVTERALGLARIYVSNGRNDEDKFMVLITQSYATGQFCLDSIRMSDSYWSQMEAVARDNATAYSERNGKSKEAEREDE